MNLLQEEVLEKKCYQGSHSLACLDSVAHCMAASSAFECLCEVGVIYSLCTLSRSISMSTPVSNNKEYSIFLLQPRSQGVSSGA